MTGASVIRGSWNRRRQKHFVIDGEAVVLNVDGSSDFNDLHSRKHDYEVQLYAFDILALGGDDLRSLPLHLRKQNRPIAGAAAGRHHRRAVRARRDRPGLLSGRMSDGPRRAGLQASRAALSRRTPEALVKVKNRSHPAMDREP
jgi:hypothetical protein